MVNDHRRGQPHRGQPVVAQALRDLDPVPLQDLARRSAAAGAHVLDLNPGYLSRRLEDRMAFMVTAVQEVTTLPLILDSPNPRVLAGGLAVSRDKPILNAVTLEKTSLTRFSPWPRRTAPGWCCCSSTKNPTPRPLSKARWPWP